MNLFHWFQKILQKFVKLDRPRADSSIRGETSYETCDEIPEMDSEGLGPVSDEPEPEVLRKKWEAEELEASVLGKSEMACPKCGLMIDAKSFKCLFCDALIFKDSGFLSRLIYPFRQDPLMAVLLLLCILTLLYIMI